MIGLLTQIADYYQDNKHDIAAKIREHTERQREAGIASRSTDALTDDICNFVSDEIKRNFDPAFGGFGMQPKFPHPDALNFAIERHALTHDEELQVVAEKTLIEMASGGMYDQFAGGFFRYSTTRDWSVPHFEKMLEDNCRLLSTCVLASRVLENDEFLQIALDVNRFLMDVLYDSKNGTFAGSQDADQEESYYGRPLSERESMPTPYIDHTVYADWNALAVSAQVDLYKSIGDEKYVQSAIRLFDFLADQVIPNHYFVAGKKEGPENQLSDITAMLGASIDLFEATGGRRFLSVARGLADLAISELFNDDAQCFRDIPPSADALGNLGEPKYDQEDNCHVSQQLIRLSAHTSNSRYRTVAESALTSFAAVYKEQSYFSSAYARAVTALLSEPVHVVLVGELDSPAMHLLKRAAYWPYAPNKTVELRSSEEGGDYPPDPDGQPTAYVCIGTNCSQPISVPEDLAQSIQQS
jgi:uncharacterized protein YyaL (SSP411 family)